MGGPEHPTQPKISGYAHFVKIVEDMVQELLEIDKEERTTFEQHALKKMLVLLGRDPSEATAYMGTAASKEQP